MESRQDLVQCADQMRRQTFRTHQQLVCRASDSVKEGKTGKKVAAAEAILKSYGVKPLEDQSEGAVDEYREAVWKLASKNAQDDMQPREVAGQARQFLRLKSPEMDGNNRRTTAIGRWLFVAVASTRSHYCTC